MNAAQPKHTPVTRQRAELGGANSTWRYMSPLMPRKTASKTRQQSRSSPGGNLERMIQNIDREFNHEGSARCQKVKIQSPISASKTILPPPPPPFSDSSPSSERLKTRKMTAMRNGTSKEPRGFFPSNRPPRSPTSVLDAEGCERQPNSQNRSTSRSYSASPRDSKGRKVANSPRTSEGQRKSAKAAKEISKPHRSPRIPRPPPGSPSPYNPRSRKRIPGSPSVRSKSGRSPSSKSDEIMNKIPERPLMEDRASKLRSCLASLRGSKGTCKKSVSFNSKVHALMIPQFTEEEKRDMHYGKEDFQTLRAELAATIRYMLINESNEKCETTTGSYCTRGLENRVGRNGKEWEKVQQRARSLVLEEQARQRKAFVQVTSDLTKDSMPEFQLDWNSVRRQCKQISLHSCRVAREFGESDFQTMLGEPSA